MLLIGKLVKEQSCRSKRTFTRGLWMLMLREGNETVQGQFRRAVWALPWDCQIRPCLRRSKTVSGVKEQVTLINPCLLKVNRMLPCQSSDNPELQCVSERASVTLKGTADPTRSLLFSADFPFLTKLSAHLHYHPLSLPDFCSLLWVFAPSCLTVVFFKGRQCISYSFCVFS